MPEAIEHLTSIARSPSRNIEGRRSEIAHAVSKNGPPAARGGSQRRSRSIGINHSLVLRVCKRSVGPQHPPESTQTRRAGASRL